MRNKDRKWFDDAYDISRGLLPFAYFTQQPPKDAVRFFRGKEDIGFERFVARMSRYFSRRCPSPEAFAEEKSRVLRLAVPELEKVFGYSDAGILFGSLVGDMDIAIIDIGEVSNTAYKKHIRSLMKKFPIIDWYAMFYFRSRSGEQVFKKILDSRKEVCQSEGLNFNNPDVYETERKYIKRTAENSLLLWGNPAEQEALVSESKRVLDN